MRALFFAAALSVAVGAIHAPPAVAQTKPDDEMRWAMYVTISAQWFDPGETVGQLTPFWILYALHDALVKPLPGNLQSPSLAESWTASGPRVEEPALMLIDPYPWSAPLEDVRLKRRAP